MIYSHCAKTKTVDGIFSLDIADEKVTLSYAGDFSGLITKGSLDINLADYRGRVVQAELVDFYDRHEVVIHDVFSVADHSLDGIDRRYNPRPLVRIAINEDGTDGILYVFGHIDNPPEGIELQERPLDKGVAAFLSELSPFFKTTFEKFRSKKHLVDNTDIRDSLAYIEAQLDALTRIVLELVKDDSEARRILAKADESSILDIKPEEKLLSEFDHKKKLRTYQQAFYTDVERIE